MYTPQPRRPGPAARVPWILLLLGIWGCSEPATRAPEGGPGDSGVVVEAVPGTDTADLPPLTHPLQINEVSAANREVLLDDYGDSPDWIELYNPHDVAVDLVGMGLSDDPGDLGRFRLPDISLDPGGFLLVYASDRTDGGLHAPFELSALGETLTLSDRHGRVQDRVETGRLYSDHSLGRDPVSGDLQIYLAPTPGAANETEGRPGLAEPPTLSPDGGFHEGAVTVSLAATSGSAALHVLVGDARAPTTDDPLYTEPLTLTGSESVVVRAVAIEDGLWPSRVVTRTFFLDRPIDLPVWSITADPDALFSETGIYSEDNVYNDQEIDAHLELYEADGTLIEGTNAGLKLHGGASQAFPQKSMRLLYRSGYGQAPLVHPVFPDAPVGEFYRLILRNAGHDDLQAELRDPFSHQLMRDLDLDVQAWRPAIVYLNGEYWGLYHTREKLDRFYVASHHGVDPEDIDLLELDGTDVKEGDSADYEALYDHVTNHDMSDDDQYAAVEDWIDVREYLLYQAIEIYSANYDWPGNNIKFWRPRTQDGRWRWTLYDTESGWGNWDRSGNPDYDSIAHATKTTGSGWPNPAWSTALFRGLLENRSFRDRFLNTYADLLNTRFLPGHAIGVLDEMAAKLTTEMHAHVGRWGSTHGWWEYQVGEVAYFLDHRPAHAWGHVLDHFELAGTWALDLSVDPPEAGRVVLSAHSVDDSFQGTYFLGVPVPVEAVAADGWVFAGWSDAALGDQTEVTLDAVGDRVVVARFEASP